MRDGEPSITAQRVAAHRLTFARVEAGYGAPADDDALARDVARTTIVGPSPMVPYLAARTAFFDRVVVGALERGMPQVVIAAAGYDGRALRYAKPDVRWFEVDHPDTQRDKRRRLERLGIDAGHIHFVPADFATDPVAAEVTAAGHDANRPSLVLCEGVAVYLDLDVLESLLRELRQLACDGSRLAISLSVAGAGERSARRRAFQAAVAAMGEPARTVLTADDAADLFDVTGWQATASPAGLGPGAARASLAGFVVVEPRPMDNGTPPG